MDGDREGSERRSARSSLTPVAISLAMELEKLLCFDLPVKDTLTERTSRRARSGSRTEEERASSRPTAASIIKRTMFGGVRTGGADEEPAAAHYQSWSMLHAKSKSGKTKCVAGLPL